MTCGETFAKFVYNPAKLSKMNLGLLMLLMILQSDSGHFFNLKF